MIQTHRFHFIMRIIHYTRGMQNLTAPLKGHLRKVYENYLSQDSQDERIFGMLTLSLIKL